MGLAGALAGLAGARMPLAYTQRPLTLPVAEDAFPGLAHTADLVRFLL